MKQEEKEQIITRIIDLEMEQLDRLFSGVKPETTDSFSEKRKELQLLRCILFGYTSQFCTIKKGS